MSTDIIYLQTRRTVEIEIDGDTSEGFTTNYDVTDGTK